jgi:putative phosphoribosyl transferase
MRDRGPVKGSPPSRGLPPFFAMTLLASSTIPYRDRQSAGQWLARELACYAGLENVLILGIPRGGVPVAAEIARALQAPLDVFVIKKICRSEDAGDCVGSMASGGVCVLNQEVLQASEAEAYLLADNVVRVRDQVMAYEQLYRSGRPPLEVRGVNLILVDDGAASGRSIRAAIAALRSMSPASITVALPVASPKAVEHFKAEADDVICPFVPDPFYSVGLAYEQFGDIPDRVIRDYLLQSEHDMLELAPTQLKADIEP